MFIKEVLSGIASFGSVVAGSSEYQSIDVSKCPLILYWRIPERIGYLVDSGCISSCIDDVGLFRNKQATPRYVRVCRRRMCHLVSKHCSIAVPGLGSDSR